MKKELTRKPLFKYNEMIGLIICNYIISHLEELDKKTIEIAEVEDKKIFIDISDYAFMIQIYKDSKKNSKCTKLSLKLNDFHNTVDKLNNFIQTNSTILHVSEIYVKVV